MVIVASSRVGPSAAAEAAVTDTWLGLERKLARLGYRRHRGMR